MSELIDRQALKDAHGLGTDCGNCKQSARSCQYDRDFSRMDFCEWLDDAPTIDAVPVEEIETYRKMWLARADKLRNSREGVAYSAMAYAAKVMLYFHDVSKHLQPPGADTKELKFKKWTLFDNADPEEEKE